LVAERFGQIEPAAPIVDSYREEAVDRPMRIRLTGLAVSVWVAVAAIGAPSASALPPNSFAPTGSMSVPRSGAAAAPLGDGRILVVGGASQYYFTPEYLRSAEVFDPTRALACAHPPPPDTGCPTGSFSPTGDLSVVRFAPVAAPLPDGRVLVAGGVDHEEGGSSATLLQSAEIFDPVTGSFSPTGSMTAPREAAAAAPLPDGRVLVAGGEDPSYLQSAEIFDPATGSFSPTGSMTVERAFPVAAPLPDGRVLVAGGVNYSPDYLQSAEIFDPVTGSFSPTGSMTSRGISAAAAPLPDGRVLMVGTGSASVEIFNPTTNSFSSLPISSTYAPRGGVVAAPLPDGRVLVAGGDSVNAQSAHTVVSSSGELFNSGLSREQRGRKLTATVAVAGTLTAADARMRRRSLKPTSATGGPGPITLKLRITRRAKRSLVRRGKLKVRASLSFVPAPVRGQCVTLIAPCYSSGHAITETPTLTLKAKKRK
jgi:hypothetical protein